MKSRKDKTINVTIDSKYVKILEVPLNNYFSIYVISSRVERKVSIRNKI